MRFNRIGQRSVETRLAQAVQRLAAVKDRLRTLGPEAVLSRGFAIIQDAETGLIIMDGHNLTQGQELIAKLARGKVRIMVVEVEE